MQNKYEVYSIDRKERERQRMMNGTEIDRKEGEQKTR